MHIGLYNKSYQRKNYIMIVLRFSARNSVPVNDWVLWYPIYRPFKEQTIKYDFPTKRKHDDDDDFLQICATYAVPFHISVHKYEASP